MLSPFACATLILPRDAVVVAKSSTNGAPPALGTPMAIGLVISILSRPPCGAGHLHILPEAADMGTAADGHGPHPCLPRLVDRDLHAAVGGEVAPSATG